MNNLDWGLQIYEGTSIETLISTEIDSILFKYIDEINNDITNFIIKDISNVLNNIRENYKLFDFNNIDLRVAKGITLHIDITEDSFQSPYRISVIIPRSVIEKRADTPYSFKLFNFDI